MAKPMDLDQLEKLLETMEAEEIRAKYGDQLTPVCQAFLASFEELDQQLAELKTFEQAPQLPKSGLQAGKSAAKVVPIWVSNQLKWALPLAAVIIAAFLFWLGPESGNPIPGNPVSVDSVTGDPAPGDPIPGDPIPGDPEPTREVTAEEVASSTPTAALFAVSEEEGDVAFSEAPVDLVPPTATGFPEEVFSDARDDEESAGTLGVARSREAPLSRQAVPEKKSAPAAQEDSPETERTKAKRAEAASPAPMEQKQEMQDSGSEARIVTVEAPLMDAQGLDRGPPPNLDSLEGQGIWTNRPQPRRVLESIPGLVTARDWVQAVVLGWQRDGVLLEDLFSENAFIHWPMVLSAPTDRTEFTRLFTAKRNQTGGVLELQILEDSEDGLILGWSLQQTGESGRIWVKLDEKMRCLQILPR